MAGAGKEVTGSTWKLKLWGAALSAPIAALLGWCAWKPCHFFTGIVMQNYATFFVLPYGAVFAYFLVSTLESSRGKVNIEFATFKFSGAAAPLLFWILIFLAFSTALHATWQQLPADAFKCDCQTIRLHPDWGAALPDLCSTSK